MNLSTLKKKPIYNFPYDDERLVRARAQQLNYRAQTKGAALFKNILNSLTPSVSPMKKKGTMRQKRMGIIIE